jgi:hypothetical protein
MTLTFMTMVAGAGLGGGLAVGVTAVVVLAAVALVVLAAANGAQLMRRVADLLEEQPLSAAPSLRRRGQSIAPTASLKSQVAHEPGRLNPP